MKTSVLENKPELGYSLKLNFKFVKTNVIQKAKNTS